MFYPENKNSTIDQAIKSLEKTYQLKKDEFKSRKAPQNLFTGSALFSQVVNSLSKPILEIQSLPKEAEEIFKFVSGKIQQEIKQDPWNFLGKTAAGSFGFGLLIARRMKLKTKARK